MNLQLLPHRRACASATLPQKLYFYLRAECSYR